MKTLPSLPCARCGKPLHKAFVGRICPRCLLASVASTSSVPQNGQAHPPRVHSVEEVHVGSRIGDYELVDVLGRGGMAVVYLARQVSLDRLVALKTIAAPKAADAQTQERFRREARAVAQLDHPGIVAVHDASAVDGALFYTMDYIEGPDLGRVLRERQLAVREAAALIRQIAEAIGYAHARGIVHRDLKPANVLIDSEGDPHVTDFGLALEGDGGVNGLTLTGDLLGTPPFMAPEILTGGAGRATASADVYSLGAMLYQMLTGRTPFIGDSASEILHLALNGQPPSIRLLNPTVPRDLQTICTKCLEKSAANRYADAGALAADVGRYLADEPIHAQPVSRPVRLLRWSRRRPALAALIVALALGAVGATAAAIAINSGRERALRAEADAREQLWHANMSHAQAARRTNEAGARGEALRAIADAAHFRPSVELRNEAIAALALDDATVVRSWDLPLDWEAAAAFDPSLESYVAETSPGVLVQKRIADNAEIARFEIPATKVVGIPVFSPNSRYMAARYSDNVVRVWEVESAHVAFELKERPTPMLPGTWNYGFDVAFRPDGNQLAVGDPAGGFTVHAVPSGEEQGHWLAETPPSIIRFSPDGHRIAVVGRSSPDVHLLDAATLTEQHLVKLPSTPIGAEWNPSGEQVALGTRAARIHFIAAETGALVDTIAAFESGSPGQLVFHPHRPIVITTGSDETLHFWNASTGGLLLRMDDVSNRPVLAFNPSGTRLGAYDAASHRASLIEVKPSTIYAAAAPPHPVRSAVATGALDASPDGRWLMSSAHGAVQLRDGRNGEPLLTIKGSDNTDMMTAQFAPAGGMLYVGSQKTGLSRIPLQTTADGAPTLGASEVLDAEPGFSIEGVAEDGRVLLVSEQAEAAKVVDPAKPAEALRWPVAKITSACFSADGQRVLTEAGEVVPGEAAVKVFSVSGTPELVASFGDDPGGRVQCSRRGDWVLVTGDKKTELWRYGTWQRGAELPADLQGELHHARLAPDGESLVIEKDRKVHLLATATGESIAVLASASSASGICVNEVFSADAARLSLLWQYGSVYVWDLAGLRRELATVGLDWSRAH